MLSRSGSLRDHIFCTVFATPDIIKPKICLTQILNFFYKIHTLGIYHIRKPNFPNPEFKFPQSKALQNVKFFLYYELYWHFWLYFDTNLKLFSRQNTQKVDKQKFWDTSDDCSATIL